MMGGAPELPPAAAGDLAAGRLVPYLGPGLAPASGRDVPATPGDLAARLTAGAAVPGRIRGNLWSAAQYIQTHRHRKTLDRLMARAFAGGPAVTDLHRHLAGQSGLPLVVDTWYDGAMAAALAESGRTDWVRLQGVSRADPATGDRWWRCFGPDGHPLPDSAADAATTVVYEPHGGIAPDGLTLVSDSDYVEVLTEIDIQTPIPPAVKARRDGRGLLILGCRFDDQMLRTFARQIARRMAGPHHVRLDHAPSRNEHRFLADELGAQVEGGWGRA